MILNWNSEKNQFSELTIVHISCYKLAELWPKIKSFSPKYPPRIPLKVSHRHTYENHSRLGDISKNIRGFKITLLGVYCDLNTLVFPGLTVKFFEMQLTTLFMNPYLSCISHFIELFPTFLQPLYRYFRGLPTRLSLSWHIMAFVLPACNWDMQVDWWLQPRAVFGDFFLWHNLAYATEIKSIRLHDSIVMALPWDMRDENIISTKIVLEPHYNADFGIHKKSVL